VIHPVAIRYAFQGDLAATLEPILENLERRLSWQPQGHLSIVDRIDKLGQALLTLREVETFGEARNGNLYVRAENFVNHLLETLESEWKIGDSSGSVIARVKRIRTAILPEMAAGKVTADERARRWRDLADAYYAQQLSHYPRDYILRERNLPERVVETVERFEEDFTDHMTTNRPFHTVIQVGEAIPIGTQRTRDELGDPVMSEIRRQLQTMINELAAERTSV
jgi:hypothetical protein